MKNTAIIIGGGIAGLFTGAFLAKNGVNVTILEKNATAGGGLQCFYRNGKVFDTGIHIMGGFEENGALTKICRYLGVYDKLDIQHIPSDCVDQIYIHSTRETFKISSGREGFIRSLGAYFPNEEDGIREYVDALFDITQEHPLYFLKETPEGIRSFSDLYSCPADALISHFVKDERLRELLAYLNPLYSGKKGYSPAYVHAFINALFISGVSRFAGGSKQLADELNELIVANGGSVLTGKEVVDFTISDREVKSVRTSDNDVYSANWFISAIHISSLLNLIPENILRNRHINLLNKVDNTYSAFSLYIELKQDVFPYIDHTCYYLDDYGLMWDQDVMNKGGRPRTFMYMTPPDSNQGLFASRMLVHCVLNFDEVRKWEHTRIGKRGAEYLKWKKTITENIIDNLEKIYPNFRNMIAHTYSASPLSIRDYLNAKDGSMFGYKKDCRNMTLAHLPVQTKLTNLLLSGQNVNMHGIYGTTLTAIQTSERILGHNKLVKAINDANNCI